MGLYTTTTTLQLRMLAVQFDSNTTSLVGEMITDAEAEINKFLSRRYDLSGATFQTTSSIPPIVRMLANRLSEGYSWLGLSRGSKESIARGKMLIDGVMENLRNISEYKVDLLDTSGSLIQDMSNTSYRVLSNTDEYSNTFNEDSPLNWAVDSDKLDDIADERDS